MFRLRYYNEWCRGCTKTYQNTFIHQKYLIYPIKIQSKLFNLPKTLKHSFKLFHLHRKSKNQVTAVSENISETKIMLPVNYKNNNYFSAIFRGSIFLKFLPFSIIQFIFFLKKSIGHVQSKQRLYLNIHIKGSSMQVSNAL